jgi:hypothetical protein
LHFVVESAEILLEADEHPPDLGSWSEVQDGIRESVIAEVSSGDWRYLVVAVKAKWK